MKLNLLTAAAGAAAAAAAEAREHNDSGRQRRTLFTSPLRVPSSLHRKARIGVRAQELLHNTEQLALLNDFFLFLQNDSLL